MPECESLCRVLLWQDIAIMKQMKKTEAQVNSLKAGALATPALPEIRNTCLNLSIVVVFLVQFLCFVPFF